MHEVFLPYLLVIDVNNGLIFQTLTTTTSSNVYSFTLNWPIVMTTYCCGWTTQTGSAAIAVGAQLCHCTLSTMFVKSSVDWFASRVFVIGY